MRPLSHTTPQLWSIIFIPQQSCKKILANFFPSSVVLQPITPHTSCPCNVCGSTRGGRSFATKKRGCVEVFGLLWDWKTGWLSLFLPLSNLAIKIWNGEKKVQFLQEHTNEWVCFSNTKWVSGTATTTSTATTATLATKTASHTLICSLFIYIKVGRRHKVTFDPSWS